MTWYSDIWAEPEGMQKSGVELKGAHPINANVFRLTISFPSQSRPEDKKVVKDCVNITRSFCDLTDVWEKMSETYIPTVVGFQGNTTLVSCLGNVFPATNSELICLSSSSFASRLSLSSLPGNRHVCKGVLDPGGVHRLALWLPSSLTVE